jgi:hypothetical protein
MSTPGLDKAYLRFAKAKEALTRAVKREIVREARRQKIAQVIAYEQGAHCYDSKGVGLQGEEIWTLWERYMEAVGEEMIYRGEWRSRRGWVDVP